ncbi:MAG: hypothetical protein VX787_10895 [Pseudomonadota bacterium]|nr:hypothetical protein [Pseudomonadota bacterium]
MLKASQWVDPRVPFVRLSSVKAATLILFSGFVISTLVIFLNSDLSRDLSYRGFNTFMEVFRFPLSLLAVYAATLALIATDHRSRQSAYGSLLSEKSALDLETRRQIDAYDCLLAALYRFSNHFRALVLQSAGTGEVAREFQKSSVLMLDELWSGFYTESRYIPAFARVVNNFNALDPALVAFICLYKGGGEAPSSDSADYVEKRDQVLSELKDLASVVRTQRNQVLSDHRQALNQIYIAHGQHNWVSNEDKNSIE